MSKAHSAPTTLQDIDLEELERSLSAVDAVAASQNVPDQVFPNGDPKGKNGKSPAGQGGEVIQLPPPTQKAPVETKLLRFPADRSLRKWLHDQAQTEESCVQYIILLALKKKGAPVSPALLRKDGRRDR